jgi:hypothetical protein
MHSFALPLDGRPAQRRALGCRPKSTLVARRIAD